ncbi:CvpA family protein [Moraxella sp. Tifton1]|uniref:CvpA family protein n=1 Tax=Moraxella oculi TaxID=2940516 RepID=A0ABW8U5P1_9GAMM|nr:CvpA family protein [Moraxella sp. Tifton1]MCL1623332.1 CvpA family protein [Moraxella sp. Tifton1]
MNPLFEAMTWLDMLIIIVVFFGLWRGFGTGLIKTVASFLSWFLALIIASQMTNLVAPWLSGLIINPVLQTAVAFLVVVLIVMMSVQATASLLSGVFKTLKLGIFDRMLGGVLGAITGLIKVLIFLSIASPLLVHLPDWHSSILAQNLLPLAPIAMQLLQQVLGESWQQIQNPYQS